MLRSFVKHLCEISLAEGGRHELHVVGEGAAPSRSRRCYARMEICHCRVRRISAGKKLDKGQLIFANI